MALRRVVGTQISCARAGGGAVRSSGREAQSICEAGSSQRSAAVGLQYWSAKRERDARRSPVADLCWRGAGAALGSARHSAPLHLETHPSGAVQGTPASQPASPGLGAGPGTLRCGVASSTDVQISAPQGPATKTHAALAHDKRIATLARHDTAVCANHSSVQSIGGSGQIQPTS